MNYLLIAFILFSTYFQAFSSFPVEKNIKNPMENPDLFGGDMVGVEFKDDRKAIPNDSMRWPGGIVYYVIDESLTNKTSYILEAMKHISDRACIKFEKRTNQKDFVNFHSGDGCTSYIGRKGGEQMLSLQKSEGCYRFRTALHEIMHALGFYHEQNRSDRDQFVTINFENIDPKLWFAFKLLKPNENRLFTPFDFDSVMLYGPTAFSINKGITMQSKIPGKSVFHHPESQGLSPDDIFSIRKLYECTEIPSVL